MPSPCRSVLAYTSRSGRVVSAEGVVPSRAVRGAQELVIREVLLFRTDPITLRNQVFRSEGYVT